MYLPKHFELNDRAAQRALITRCPLATLVLCSAAGLDANHLPLRWREQDGQPRLVGHVARANPLWREADGLDVLAIFHDAQAYVSPQWYPSKRVDGRAVPTWNYSVVHAHGQLRAIEDPAWLREFLDQLSAEQEAFQAQPWRLDEAPPDYVEKQLRAIVGIEIAVSRFIGKAKRHQNHPQANRQGVIDGLETRDHQSKQMAEQMRQDLTQT